MNRYIFACAVVFSLLASHCHAQGTAFTYQGRLTSGSTPFTGDAEFQPTLWNDPTSGTQIAANSPATLIVAVTNGHFVLPLDFGAAALAGGADRWLQLQVRTSIGAFTTLSPRQKLTPAPYSIFSANAATANTAATANSVSAANITGQLGLAQLPPTVVTNTQAGLSLAGTFSGNGGALTNLSPNALTFSSSGLSVVTWGWNEYNQLTVPPGLNDLVSVAAGATHSLGLRANGTVVAWGAGFTNDPAAAAERGQSIVPAGLTGVAAISAGYLHSLALRSNGTVVAWGWNEAGQTNLPVGLNNVRAISAALYHNLALRNDGTVVGWGSNSHGQLVIPPGLSDVKAISAGYIHNLALRSNGTVVAWGANDYNATNVPPLSDVVAISAGATLSIALHQNGTITVWGTNDNGELNVPPGLTNVVAISAGLQQAAVLKADGTVVSWGFNQYGTTNVPPGLNNVVYLGPSLGYHYVALRRRSDAPVAWLNSDNTFNGNVEVNGSVHAVGEMVAGGGLRLNDQNLWLRKGSDTKNALGWYGDDKVFSPYGTPRGPVLFGESGGALATSSTNGARVALKWDDQQQVTIGDPFYGTGASLRIGNQGFGMSSAVSEFRFYVGGSGRFAFKDSINGTDTLSINPAGFGFGGTVGIGTANPTARLDVRGEIKFGNNGQYYPAAVDENLRMIRGVVNAAGTILAGTGFTVTKSASVGFYTINFSPTFSSLPAVTVTPQSGIYRIATCTSVGTGSVGIWVRDLAGNGVDNQFNFIAIGPR